MDNKNVFIAIALSMSVLLFWTAFFETPKTVNNKINQQEKVEETVITLLNPIFPIIVKISKPWGIPPPFLH